MGMIANGAIFCFLISIFTASATVVSINQNEKFFPTEGFMKAAQPVVKQNLTKILRFGGPNTAHRYFPDNGTVAISQYNYGGGTWGTLNRYLYGKFTVYIKLPTGFSAGICSTLYMASTDPFGSHDEIDLEFLGHVNSSKIILHTNYFANGVGAKEEQFRFWFDPAKGFHKYTIQWSWKGVIIFVNNVPLREIVFNRKNKKSRINIRKPMHLLGTIWDASPWATEGGKIKANYTYQPFTTAYKDFNFKETCLYSGRKTPPCANFRINQPWDSELSVAKRKQMQKYRNRYLKYSYLSLTPPPRSPPPPRKLSPPPPRKLSPPPPKKLSPPPPKKLSPPPPKKLSPPPPKKLSPPPPKKLSPPPPKKLSPPPRKLTPPPPKKSTPPPRRAPPRAPPPPKAATARKVKEDFLPVKGLQRLQDVEAQDELVPTLSYETALWDQLQSFRNEMQPLV